MRGTESQITTESTPTTTDPMLSTPQPPEECGEGYSKFMVGVMKKGKILLLNTYSNETQN